MASPSERKASRSFAGPFALAEGPFYLMNASVKWCLALLVALACSFFGAGCGSGSSEPASGSEGISVEFRADTEGKVSEEPKGASSAPTKGPKNDKQKLRKSTKDGRDPEADPSGQSSPAKAPKRSTSELAHRLRQLAQGGSQVQVPSSPRAIQRIVREVERRTDSDAHPGRENLEALLEGLQKR